MAADYRAAIAPSGTSAHRRTPARRATRSSASATDPDFISDVVRFDLPLLGDVSGLRGVHLQCHIGTDTISLSRLGATMVGLDFSSASLAEARRLAGDAPPTSSSSRPTCMTP